MHMSFFDVLQSGRQNPGTPNVAVALTVHHTDGTVLFGYGSLRYYADIPNLPSSGIPPLGHGGVPSLRLPIEGLSSRQSLSSQARTKFVSNAERSYVLRGSWNEPQSYIVSVAQSIALSIYLPPPIPHRPHSSNPVLSIEFGTGSFNLRTEVVGTILQGNGQGLQPSNEDAAYVISFGDQLVGDVDDVLN